MSDITHHRTPSRENGTYKKKGLLGPKTKMKERKVISFRRGLGRDAGCICEIFQDNVPVKEYNMFF